MRNRSNGRSQAGISGRTADAGDGEDYLLFGLGGAPVGGRNLLVYRVRGSGFLHHMVRNLVGTMLDVGRGHLAAARDSGDSCRAQPRCSRTDRSGAGVVSCFGGVSSERRFAD